MSEPPASLPPVVCTLTTRDRGERELEWSDLGALSLTSEEIADGVASTYPLELGDKVRDLATRESACCGTWLQSTVTDMDDHLRLELTTNNPDGLAMIRSMSGFDT